MAPDTIKREALALARQGIPVFPCRPDKRPYVQRGLHAASTDLATVESWFSTFKDAKIGVPTGERSGWWVVDLDRKPGVDGPDSWADLEVQNGRAEDTRTVCTPSGGYHLYFKHPGAGIKVGTNAGQLGLGIDIRGDGGYVIVPPSAGYEYEAGSDMHIADGPAWLLKRCTVREDPPLDPTSREEQDSREVGREVDEGVDVAQCIANILNGSPLHDSLRDLAAHFMATGVSEYAAIEILRGVMLRSDALRTRPSEWQERFQDIDRQVHTARQFVRPDPLKDPVMVPGREDLQMLEGELAAASLTPRCIIRDHTYADVAQVVAPGGTGKTTIMLYELICVVLGRPVWGMTVENPGWCLIVTAEDQRERLIARTREIMDDNGVSMEERRKIMRGLLIWDVTGEQLALTCTKDGNLMLTPLADSIVDRFRDDPPAIVMFDPLVSFGVSEERVNTNEQALITAARRIVKGLDCCVRYIHHTGKNNARDKTLDQYTGRGGSALADGSRMTTVLQAWDDESRSHVPPTGCKPEKGASIVILSRSKLSYAPPNLPLIWIKRTGYRFEHFYEQKLSADERSDAEAAQVLRFLAHEIKAGVHHTQKTITDSRDRLSLSRDRLRLALATLMASGQVVEQPLPDNLKKGGRKTYLCPTNLADGAREVEQDEEVSA